MLFIYMCSSKWNLACEGCMLNIYNYGTKDKCSSDNTILNVNVIDSNITIEKDFFKVFNNLKTLKIQHSEDNFKIDNKPFVITSNLEKFQCQCELKEIFIETFTQLLKLTDINIDNNNLTCINSESIVILKHLQTFTMNKNHQFNFMADEAFLISQSLIQYECEYCGIDKIYTETFRRLPNIQIIKLNYNKIIQIDENSFLNNLYIIELYFSNNLLVSFQPDIKKLENLKILCLSENQCNNNESDGIDYHAQNKLFKQNYMAINLSCPTTSANVEQHESLPWWWCVNNIKLEAEPSTISIIPNSAIINTTTVINTSDINDIITIMNTTDDDNNNITIAIENPTTLTINDTMTTDYNDKDDVLINTIKSEIKPNPNIIIIQTSNVTIGISDAFIVSYLLLIIITQIFIILVIWYSFKLLRSNGNEQFDYSSTILSDHEMYKTS